MYKYMYHSVFIVYLLKDICAFQFRVIMIQTTINIRGQALCEYKFSSLLGEY